jgi:hypothetical protein
MAQCKYCPGIVLTSMKDTPITYVNGQPFTFIDGYTCNSNAHFYYSTDGGASWILNSTEIYSQPGGFVAGAPCVAYDRFQNCPSYLMGDCIRIQLQGNPGRSVARTVVNYKC